MPEYVPTPGKGAATKEKAQVKRPRRYCVLLHNDDYTSMEFVVRVLVDIFKKPPKDAVEIMFNVHRQGVGRAGVYPKAIAETKVGQVHDLAREHGYPLRCSVEPE